MQLPFLIAIYCLAIVLASLVGGWLPSRMALTHLHMQTTMSFVSGLMLGIALLHMLPQAAEHLTSISEVAGGLLAGLLVMFFLLRVFHVHGHGGLDHENCDHEHELKGAHRGRLNWVGLYFGLAVHTLFDGVALSASVVADAGHGTPRIALYGLGTFLAVVLHKPLDTLAITSVMHGGGWTERSRMIANSGYALMCPLGALLFWFGASHVAEGHSAVVGFALAFSAGFFICISLGDLLPEVQFHSHDRLKLSVALLLGVAVAYGIEMTHSHGRTHEHGHEPTAEVHEHELTSSNEASPKSSGRRGLSPPGRWWFASAIADRSLRLDL